MLLRSLLRAKPHLRACLTRCRHCGIFFLTHPRKYCAPEPPSERPRPPARPRRRPRWNPLMVEYVRMAVSLIEGRRVSRGQVLRMLARHLRQHTMSRRRWIDQTVAWLNEEPP